MVIIVMMLVVRDQYLPTHIGMDEHRLKLEVMNTFIPINILSGGIHDAHLLL